MVKKIVIIGIVAACISFLGGCSGKGYETAPSENSSNTESKEPAPAAENPAVTEGEIGLEQAKTLALVEVGLEESDGSWTKEKTDREDGHTVYELEFVSAEIEYDFEIDAKSGDILKYEEEYVKKSPVDTEEGIGLEKAKTIALEEAGLKEKDGSWTKEKTDREDGHTVYELEFVSGEIEYDFEIDAKNGEILEYQKESIYD